MTKLISIIILFFSTSLFATKRAYIDVGKAKVKKSLLAFPALQYYGSAREKESVKLGQNLFSTVKNDLDVSAMFSFIDPKAFLEDTRKVGLRPAPGFPKGFKFSNWTPLETEFLIRAGYKVIKGQIIFDTYVYYVPQAKLIFNQSYKGSKNNFHRIGHKFASDLIEKLTGKKAMFNSKLTFTSDRFRKGEKEVYIMDWDGKNIQKITNHRGITLSPNWSRDGRKITYSSYTYHRRLKKNNIDLFIYDLMGRKRFLASYKTGINSGGGFFPGDKQIALSISLNSNPNIYSMNLTGKKVLKQLTRGPNRAMNVEPAISPDGSKIAFSSDRSGRPMIYIMSKNGGKARRVTFAGKYNASPSWSPDGKKLAFAGYDKGHFDIFTVNLDGTGLKRLTSARKSSGRFANNEDPSWSPDGRFIVFTSNRTGNNQLYMINSDGNNERRITYDRHQYYKPKWSPYIN